MEDTNLILSGFPFHVIEFETGAFLREEDFVLGTGTEVKVVVEVSRVMRAKGLYSEGFVQALLARSLALGTHLNESHAVELFSLNSCQQPPLTQDNLEGYALKHLEPLIGGAPTDFPSTIHDVLWTTTRDEPTLVLIFCIGNQLNLDGIHSLLAEARDRNIFFNILALQRLRRDLTREEEAKQYTSPAKIAELHQLGLTNIAFTTINLTTIDDWRLNKKMLAPFIAFLRQLEGL